MPQMLLPLFCDEMTPITPTLAYEKRDGEIYYFHGSEPIFHHREEDVASLRMIACQFVANGLCRQVDVARALGVSEISLKRAMKLYRLKGPAGFYQRRAAERTPRVLTAEVVGRAEELLGEGLARREVAERLEIKEDTLRKAIALGRVRAPLKKTSGK